MLAAGTLNPWPRMGPLPFNPTVGTMLAVIALLGSKRVDPMPVHADDLRRLAPCLNRTTLVLAATIAVLGNAGP